MILSRAPLTEQAPRVRLACIRHAASVRPEPGSNSSLYGLEGSRRSIRTKRNGSGTCASSRFSCEGTGCRHAGRGRIKNQGSACHNSDANTWRRLWPHGQRVSRKDWEAREPSCCVYRVNGETTAVNNVAQYSTLLESCQIAVLTWFVACASRPASRGGVRNEGYYTTRYLACQAL